MTERDQRQLGKTLWNIADQLRGAMNADDFRDYMLAFLFLRYLSDNYEAAAKRELGKDYPDPDAHFGTVNIAQTLRDGELTWREEPLAQMPDELKRLFEED